MSCDETTYRQALITVQEHLNAAGRALPQLDQETPASSARSDSTGEYAPERTTAFVLRWTMSFLGFVVQEEVRRLDHQHVAEGPTASDQLLADLYRYDLREIQEQLKGVLSVMAQRRHTALGGSFGGVKQQPWQPDRALFAALNSAIAALTIAVGGEQARMGPVVHKGPGDHAGQLTPQ